MNTTNYIRIFRGDDSDALGYQTIVGTIKTDIDLAGCKAIFRFLGFYAEFDPIPEDKKLTIVIPAQASRGFPPGVGYASLKVIDAYGKIRTFTNRIPVIVDTMTPSSGYGEFEVSFSPFPELEPLKIFIGPNADDFDQYTGFVSKIIDRASLVKYGLVVLADAMGEDGGASGKAASPLAVKAAYDAIIKELVDNYYTAKQTDEAIERVAAYYITYNAAGAAFPTRADLLNATTYYSGGAARIPTRNDYAVVLADETHGGAEWRYIYAVADGATTGQWEAQYPIETNDYEALSNKPQINGMTLFGNKTAADLGLASTADATLTERFSAWTVEFSPDSPLGYAQPTYDGAGHWRLESSTLFYVAEGMANATTLDFVAIGSESGDTAHATRTALPGYQLGSQTDKPLASEAEAEALRNDKLSTSGGTVTGDINMVNGILDAGDVQTRTYFDFAKPGEGPKSLDAPENSGKALTDADLSDSNSVLAQALAGKLNNTTDTMSGSLTVQGILTVGSRERSSAVGANSVAEGHETIAEGDYSHAEGVSVMATGSSSHAEGFSTKATNSAEHAQGRNNASHTGSTLAEKTLSSIGFGTADNARKNAVETMQDGKTFIYGLGDYDGTNPTGSGAKDLATEVNAKLDSTSAAPAFSSDSSVSYPVGSHCTYQGKLYKCTTATTGGTWDASKWTADTMTDPDAVLDITAQNQLRVVAKDGTLLWAQGYDLASTSSATLACDATNNFTFADGASMQAFTLPTAPTGKVGDFGLDIDNSANTGAATMTLTGLDTTFSVVVPEGESLNDMLSIAAGELARFYVTLTTFRVNNLPTWHIVKQVVENGGAQS